MMLYWGDKKVNKTSLIDYLTGGTDGYETSTLYQSNIDLKRAFCLHFLSVEGKILLPD